MGIEIGLHRIYTMYLPVALDDTDKIHLCYEGISQIIMNAREVGKKVTIIGDLNSHVEGFC